MKSSQLPQKIVNALSKLNLTEKEIATYVCLLENGSLTVQEISRLTGINRMTIYASIDELKLKGLIVESRRGTRKMFLAEEPEKLKTLLEQKKLNLLNEQSILENLLLPTLRAISIKEENRPVIKFFEGAEGINRVYDEFILNNREAINCGSYETASSVVSLKDEEKYFESVKEKKMFYRVILQDSPLNRKYAEKSHGIIHTKFLPEDQRVTADIVVAGKTCALISYDRKTATVIEDRSIAESMKFYLDFMWDNL